MTKPRPLSPVQERALFYLVTGAYTQPTVQQIGALFSRCYVDERGRVTTLGLGRVALMDGQRCEDFTTADKNYLDSQERIARKIVERGKRVYAEQRETISVRARARRARVTLAAIELARSGNV